MHYRRASGYVARAYWTIWRSAPFLYFSAILSSGCGSILDAMPFAPERQEARLAYQLGRFARRLEEIARIELARVFDEETPDRTGDGQTQIGIDIDLAHAVLDTFLDFFDRHAIGLFHVAAELAYFRQQLLRHR